MMSRSGGLKERAGAGRPEIDVRQLFTEFKRFNLLTPILTIGNQVDPQELDWDKSFWDTESGGEEDANDFTNVGRDKITDELNQVIKKDSRFDKWIRKRNILVSCCCKWRDLLQQRQQWR